MDVKRHAGQICVVLNEKTAFFDALQLCCRRLWYGTCCRVFV